MDLDKVSDIQLYSLLRNENLARDLKQMVSEEFKRRNFSIEYIDKLAMEHEGVAKQTASSLSFFEKFLIVLIPFFPVIHAILANRHISKGNKNKWQQHWNYVALGYVLWTGAIILFAKFYLFRSS